MELVAFKDMNTAQSIAVMAHLKSIPSANWLNDQKFAVDGGKVVLPLCSAEPCCMWCGGAKPEGGWHFLQYPQALCSEKCLIAFKAAY